MTTHARRHRRNHLTTRVLAAGVAVAAAAGIAAVVSPTAGASDTGNIVTFGDSFTANPDQVRNTLRDVPGPLGEWARDGYPETNGCLQAPNNSARKIGAATQRAVSDWSCTAQTSRSMLGRVDQAIAAGAVRDDSTVLIAIGMNDFGPYGAVENGNLALLDPAGVQRDYLANLQTAAGKLRGAAPDVEIKLVGALPTVDRIGAMFCALNIVPNAPAGIPVPAIRDVENWNRGNQQLAAEKIGAQFIDIMEGARGHDTCATDTQRYVAGIIDFTTPEYNMAFHPSDKGSAYVARKVAEALS